MHSSVLVAPVFYSDATLGKIVSRQIFAAFAALLIFSIFVSPRLGASATGTDILTIIAAPALIFHLRRAREILGNRILVPATLFLVYSLVVSAITALPIHQSLFNFAAFQFRIAQGFIILALVAVAASYYPRLVQRAFVFGIAVIGGYALYQLVTRNFNGYYGFIGLPFERGPSQGGTVFAMSAIFFVYLINMGRRRLVLAFCMIALIGCAVGTISRTSMLGLGTTIVLFPILALSLRRVPLFARNMRLYFSIMIVAGFGAFAFLTYTGVGPDLVEYALRRLANIEGSSEVRTTRWMEYFHALEQRTGLAYLTGLGLGAHQAVMGKAVLAFDSQYLRLVFETGVVGFLLWVWAHLNLLRRIRRLNRLHLFCALLLTTFIGMVCFTHEILFVGKPAAAYYAFMGFFLGEAYRVSQLGRLAEPARVLRHHPLSCPA